MPRTVIEYRCLLISPSDVGNERQVLTECVNGWNAQIGQMLGARVNLVLWETHSTPDMSGEPQAVLNRQIVDDCDLGLALFWSRLGTATSQHASGSVEEIERLLARGARVMVYFKGSPIPQDQIDLKQFKKLKEMKAEFMRRGILGTFDTAEELKEKVQLHMTVVITDFLNRDGAKAQQSATASNDVLPKPAIKVRVQPAMTAGFQGRSIDLIGIRVENHSTIPVYLRNITLLLKTEQMLLPQRDSVTGVPQARRMLNPGESFGFNVAVDELLEHGFASSQFDRVCVVDDIGRSYFSEADELGKIIEYIVNARATK